MGLDVSNNKINLNVFYPIFFSLHLLTARLTLSSLKHLNSTSLSRLSNWFQGSGAAALRRVLRQIKAK